jgi:pyruvate kinase
VPTRAEASDVATAIYDGADAVMLSAESASGKYPIEAVRMMDSIIAQTEADPFYREAISAAQTPRSAVPSDAIGVAVRGVADLLKVAAVVAYTSSGYSALRMARERPKAPILGLTPRQAVARQLALAWGVYPVLCDEVMDVLEMSDWACQTAKKEGLALPGETIVISAGVPFGTSGTTNLLRIAQVD